jgi:hypothetical protein
MVAFVALLVLPNEWRVSARRSVRPMAISVGAIGVVVLPMVPYVVGHGSTNTWVPPASAVALLRLLWNMAGHDAIYGILLGATIIALTVLVAHGRDRRDASGGPLPRALMIALACWLCFPIAASYAVTQQYLNLHLFAWGYLVTVVPALCLLAAVAVAALHSPRLRIATAAGLLAVASFATPIYSSVPAQDFRTASRWITERYEPGDGLVSTTWSGTLAMDYYTRIGVVPSTVIAGSPSRSDWIVYGERPLDARAVADYAAAHSRIFLLSGLQVGDSPLMKEEVNNFGGIFDRGYVLLDHVVVPSKNGDITIGLYRTGPDQ